MNCSKIFKNPKKAYLTNQRESSFQHRGNSCRLSQTCAKWGFHLPQGRPFTGMRRSGLLFMLIQKHGSCLAISISKTIMAMYSHSIKTNESLMDRDAGRQWSLNWWESFQMDGARMVGRRSWNFLSILGKGLIPGGKEKDKARQAVFLTPTNPFGDDPSKRNLMMNSQFRREHLTLQNGSMIRMQFSRYNCQRRRIKDWNSGRRSHLQSWPALQYLGIVLIVWHLKTENEFFRMAWNSKAGT